MSKYQVDQNKVRKEEVEAHQSSFQDKQYSYSRTSQQGSKILDNANKALNQNKSNDADILDLIDSSFPDENELFGKEQNIASGQQSKKNKQNENKEQLDPLNNNPEEIENNETQIKQEPNLKASQKLADFFKKTPDAITEQSKNSVTKFYEALLKMDSKTKQKQNEVHQAQKEDQNKVVNEDNEGIVDEDEFAIDDQQYYMQDENQKNSKKKKPEGGQQDFGNISEIQEKKNIRENNDETAQDEDFSALLRNPTKKQDDDQIQNEDQTQQEVNEYNNDHTFNNNSQQDVRQGRRQNSQEGQNESQEEYDQNMKSSMRKSNGSGSPLPQYSPSLAAEEKLKKIEEAQRKKRELEEELRALQSEIAQINQNDEDKKKKKENKFIKHEQISEDKEAQEQALNLIRKMNQARKEKELKQQKEREMFNKFLQEDLKESHERQVRLKDKVMNEKKERIQQKIDSLKMRSEERKVINKQSNYIIKDIKRDLYINDPDERYKQEVELPELEKRKKELAEKRKLYKPIDMDEIRDHAKKHDEDIKLRKLQAKTNILAEYNNLEENNHKFPKYSALNKVLEDDKLYKMKDILEMQKKKEQIERRKEYAKLVKEVHVPRVKPPRPNLEYYGDDQQQNDIDSQYNQQQYQASSHNQIRTPNNYGGNQVFKVKRNTAAEFSSNSNTSPINNQGRQNRLNYNPNKNQNASKSKGRNSARDSGNRSSQKQKDFYNNTEQLPSNNQNNYYSNPGFDNVENNNFESNRAPNALADKSSYSASSVTKPIRQKAFKPPAIEEPPQPAPKKFQNDYIQELRKQREQQEKKQGKKAKLEDWEKYKYDPSLSSNEKYKYILQSANRLEHNARLKELRSNNNNDFEAQEQANDLYIDSIKAKLALLDNMS